MKDLDIEKAEIQKPELQLALQLIDQISEDSYDPAEFEDEEKKRILAAIDDKIAGKQIVVTEGQEPAAGGQVIDLVDALRASLAPRKATAKTAPVPVAPVAEAAKEATKERKSAKRATPAPVAVEAAAAPARARARK
jgi:DNA end-binding protein Ku